MISNPGDIPVSEAVFADAFSDQREHIQAVTSIAPDSRQRIPISETQSLVLGTQNSEPSALTRLISTRIVSLYEYIGKSTEIAERDDITLADSLNMSCLSIAEAALAIRASSKYVGILLYSESVRELGKLLTNSKLIASRGESGQRLISTANGNEARIIDRAEPVGDINDVAKVEQDDFGSHGTREIPQPGDSVLLEQARNYLLKGNWMRGGITDRQKYILARRFGFLGVPTYNYTELAEEFGVSRERPRQIEEAYLSKARRAHFHTTVDAFSTKWLPGTYYPRVPDDYSHRAI